MGDEGLLDEAERVSLATVRALRDRLNTVAREGVSQRMALGVVQELEFLVAAANAWQIELTAASAQDQSARLAGAGVGFARRRHPVAGARLVHRARVLTSEMPQVLAAMRSGELSEAQAEVLVRETEGLDPAAKAEVAQELSDRWCGTGDRRLADMARGVVSRKDPGLAQVRAVAAAADRHVSWRAAPDAMLRITALLPALPARDGLACVQSLESATREAVAAQKPTATLADRRRAMADAFVAKVAGTPQTGTPQTGTPQTGARQGNQPAVDVRVNLLVPIDALTGDAPGWLDGYGTAPGHLVRELIEGCPDEAGPLIRRVFTAPGSGDLVGMESSSRTYRGLLREFIRLRDQRCRTPYCESPIVQIDHIEPVAKGGATSERNAKGDCVRCNQIKELAGYEVAGDASGVTTTVGGVHVTSRPPAPPGREPPSKSAIERKFVDIIWTKIIVRPAP